MSFTSVNLTFTSNHIICDCNCLHRWLIPFQSISILFAGYVPVVDIPIMCAYQVTDP